MMEDYDSDMHPSPHQPPSGKYHPNHSFHRPKLHLFLFFKSLLPHHKPKMSRAYITFALLALSTVGLGQTTSTTVLPATQGGPLNITALATRDNTSVIECWQLPGLPVILGSTVHWQLASQAAKPELTVLGPNTTVGQAWSSAVQ